MVFSRSEVKRRNREVHDPLGENPKRTKVHAQRKFAQGSGMNSPIMTPIKEKEKTKPNGAPSPAELLPSKRPATDDFLNFLSFRGTSALSCLSSRVDIFNEVTNSNHASSSRQPSSSSPGSQKGKSRSTSQEFKKRLADRRSGLQKGNAMRARTASDERQAVRKKAIERQLRKKEAQRRVKPARKPHPAILKRLGASRHRAGLRSGGKLPPGSDVGLKTDRKPKRGRPPRRKKITALKKSKMELESSPKRGKKVEYEDEEVEEEEEEEEDDDGVEDDVSEQEESEESEEEALEPKDVEYKGPQKKSLRTTRTREASNSPASSSKKQSSRPTRKTKEAATLYMEMLTKDLRNPEEEFDDDYVRSFPDLPSELKKAHEDYIKSNSPKRRGNEKRSVSPNKDDKPKTSRLSKDRSNGKEAAGEEEVPQPSRSLKRQVKKVIPKTKSGIKLPGRPSKVPSGRLKVQKSPPGLKGALRRKFRLMKSRKRSSESSNEEDKNDEEMDVDEDVLSTKSSPKRVSESLQAKARATRSIDQKKNETTGSDVTSESMKKKRKSLISSDNEKDAKESPMNSGISKKIKRSAEDSAPAFNKTKRRGRKPQSSIKSENEPIPKRVSNRNAKKEINDSETEDEDVIKGSNPRRSRRGKNDSDEDEGKNAKSVDQDNVNEISGDEEYIPIKVRKAAQGKTKNIEERKEDVVKNLKKSPYSQRSRTVLKNESDGDSKSSPGRPKKSILQKFKYKEDSGEDTDETPTRKARMATQKKSKGKPESDEDTDGTPKRKSRVSTQRKVRGTGDSGEDTDDETLTSNSRVTAQRKLRGKPESEEDTDEAPVRKSRVSALKKLRDKAETDEDNDEAPRRKARVSALKKLRDKAETDEDDEVPRRKARVSALKKLKDKVESDEDSDESSSRRTKESTQKKLRGKPESDDDADEIPVRKSRISAQKKFKGKPESDEDDADEAPIRKSRGIALKKLKGKSESDEDDGDEVPIRKSRGIALKKLKGKSESDEDDGDEVPIRKTRVSAQKKFKGKSESDEDDAGDVPRRKSRVSAQKKLKGKPENYEDEMEEMPIRKVRASAQKKIKDSPESDDEAEVVPTRKVQVSAQKVKCKPETEEDTNFGSSRKEQVPVQKRLKSKPENVENVDIVPTRKARLSAQKKLKDKPESDENSDEEPIRKPRTSIQKKIAVRPQSEYPDEVPMRRARMAAQKKLKAETDSDQDSEEEPARKARVTAQMKFKSKTECDMESDEEPIRKARAPLQKKLSNKTESDEESDKEPRRKSRLAAQKKSKAKTESDEDFEEQPTRKVRMSAQKKLIAKNESDEDSGEESTRKSKLLSQKKLKSRPESDEEEGIRTKSKGPPHRKSKNKEEFVELNIQSMDVNQKREMKQTSKMDSEEEMEHEENLQQKIRSKDDTNVNSINTANFDEAQQNKTISDEGQDKQETKKDSQMDGSKNIDHIGVVDKILSDFTSDTEEDDKKSKNLNFNKGDQNTLLNVEATEQIGESSKNIVENNEKDKQLIDDPCKHIKKSIENKEIACSIKTKDLQKAKKNLSMTDETNTEKETYNVRAKHQNKKEINVKSNANLCEKEQEGPLLHTVEAPGIHIFPKSNKSSVDIHVENDKKARVTPRRGTRKGYAESDEEDDHIKKDVMQNVSSASISYVFEDVVVLSEESVSEKKNDSLYADQEVTKKDPQKKIESLIKTHKKGSFENINKKEENKLMIQTSTKNVLEEGVDSIQHKALKSITEKDSLVKRSTKLKSSVLLDDKLNISETIRDDKEYSQSHEKGMKKTCENKIYEGDINKRNENIDFQVNLKKNDLEEVDHRINEITPNTFVINKEINRPTEKMDDKLISEKRMRPVANDHFSKQKSIIPKKSEEKLHKPIKPFTHLEKVENIHSSKSTTSSLCTSSSVSNLLVCSASSGNSKNQSVSKESEIASRNLDKRIEKSPQRAITSSKNVNPVTDKISFKRDVDKRSKKSSHDNIQPSEIRTKRDDSKVHAKSDSSKEEKFRFDSKKDSEVKTSGRDESISEKMMSKRITRHSGEERYGKKSDNKGKYTEGGRNVSLDKYSGSHTVRVTRKPALNARTQYVTRIEDDSTFFHRKNEEAKPPAPIKRKSQGDRDSCDTIGSDSSIVECKVVLNDIAESPDFLKMQKKNRGSEIKVEKSSPEESAEMFEGFPAKDTSINSKLSVGTASSSSSFEAAKIDEKLENKDSQKPKPSISETWRQAFKNAKIPKIPGHQSPVHHGVKPFVRQKVGSSLQGKSSDSPDSKSQDLNKPRVSPSLSPFKAMLANQNQRSLSPDAKRHLSPAHKVNFSGYESPGRKNDDTKTDLRKQDPPVKTLTQLQYEKRSSQFINSFLDSGPSPPVLPGFDSLRPFKKEMKKDEPKEVSKTESYENPPEPVAKPSTEGKHLNLPLAVEHTLRKMSPITVSKKPPQKPVSLPQERRIDNVPITKPVVPTVSYKNKIEVSPTPTHSVPPSVSTNVEQISQPLPPVRDIVVRDLPDLNFLPKKKVYVTNEEINRWLNDNTSSGIEHKKDCGIFENNQCECSYRTSGASMQNSVGVSELVSKDDGKVDHGVVEPPVQLKELDKDGKYIAETISTCKVEEYKEKLLSKTGISENKMAPPRPRRSSGQDRFKSNKSMTDDEMCDYGFRFDRTLNSPRESMSDASSITHRDDASSSSEVPERKIFHQKRSGSSKRPSISSPSAFSAENESSVYAFKPDPPSKKPFRRGRGRSGDHDEGKQPSSSSIAVQVNLETQPLESRSKKSTGVDCSTALECSTQTERYYIPLAEESTPSKGMEIDEQQSQFVTAKNTSFPPSSNTSSETPGRKTFLEKSASPATKRLSSSSEDSLIVSRKSWSTHVKEEGDTIPSSSVGVQVNFTLKENYEIKGTTIEPPSDSFKVEEGFVKLQEESGPSYGIDQAFKTEDSFHPLIDQAIKTEVPEDNTMASGKPRSLFPPTVSNYRAFAAGRSYHQKPEQKVRPLCTASERAPVGTVQPMTREPEGTDQSCSVNPEKTRLSEKASNQGSPMISKGSEGSRTSRNSTKALKAADIAPVQCSTPPIAIEWKGTEFPPTDMPATLVEAPTFYPTEKEFQDPLEYIDQLTPLAQSFGICKIVPPSSFKPECKVSDDMRFTAYNQYVHRMMERWGPNVRELCAIKKYLATQSISLIQLPLIGSMEVDLPRLYQTVQQCGGLKEVIEKKRWARVADAMRIPKSAQDRVTKLDDIYCKFLLPYDTLSHEERTKLLEEVDQDWKEREKRLAAEEDSGNNASAEGSDESSDTDDNIFECITKGKNMPLSGFYRIARNTMATWFKDTTPTPSEVETEYWRHVSTKTCHVCVHCGSIDSGTWGYGFPTTKTSATSRHPWNLKVLTNSPGSILRSLGPLMGITVPTLHVGMLFSSYCWYRDPHALPWIEYLHTGASKIWYGVPDSRASELRKAMYPLLPRHTRDRTIWLPSDTMMVPPQYLLDGGVSLCRVVQEPGQFILVFPKAFTSSISTGYVVSESVYFAQPSWLNTAEQVFKDIQDSCEPPVFSLHKLLFNIASDTRSSADILIQILPMVKSVIGKEVESRKKLEKLGLTSWESLPSNKSGRKKKKEEDQGDLECDTCRGALFLSMVTNSNEDCSYCIDHAIEVLSKDQSLLKYCKLLIAYDEEEMEELVEKVKTRIETKTQKKQKEKGASSGAKI